MWEHGEPIGPFLACETGSGFLFRNVAIGWCVHNGAGWKKQHACWAMLCQYPPKAAARVKPGSSVTRAARFIARVSSIAGSLYFIL